MACFHLTKKSISAFLCGQETVPLNVSSLRSITSALVVRLEIDGIQNAANKSMLGGGGSATISF